MLKISLFGPPQVLLDSHLLTGLTRSRQLIALLAYLVLHPGPHLRERLAGLFWPDIADRRAQSNLNNLIWRLRSALERAAECVASDAVSAWFVAEDVFVDVYAFQALITSDDVHNLAEGAALVQGDLLDGQDSEWCLTLRARFQQDYAQLLLKLLRQQQASGQWAEASQLAQRLIDLEPFDDEAHVLRVEIECQRGRWSEAKRCFHDYEKLWRDELKLTPSMRMQAVLAAYHLFHTPQVVATLVVQLGDPVLELLANAQQARAKYDYDLALNYLVKAGGMLEALPTSRLMPAHLNVLRECDEIYDLLAERRLQAENLDVLARLSDRFADSGAKYDYWSRRTWLYIASDDYSNAVAA